MSDAPQRRCTDSSCGLVIAHEGVLGGLVANIEYIKKKVDNGLTEKLDKVENTVSNFVTLTNERAKTIDAQNWFSRLLTGSVKKILGLVVIVIFANALVSNSMWAWLKTHYLKEMPGQQAAILEHLGASYHSHMLKDGSIVLHADDSAAPAWKLDRTTNSWVKAPTLRTDEQLRGAVK